MKIQAGKYLYTTENKFRFMIEAPFSDKNIGKSVKEERKYNDIIAQFREAYYEYSELVY